ncbi:MAG: TetR/AcrR family transcriptional regulator [Actinomycetes bacterium]
MSELGDRRARKKAKTRQMIVDVAQGLFAERGFEKVTVADIASRADVAVQTVFNHFPSKEDIFFVERAEWVDGFADAVRNRPDGVLPLTALREHCMKAVRRYLRVLRRPEVQVVVATLEASPALRAFERELHHEAVVKLSAALIEACPDGGTATGAPPSATLRASASLTASVWLGAVRGLLVEQRAELTEAVGAHELAVAVERLAEQVLGQLEATSTILQCCAAVELRPTPAAGVPEGTRRVG